MEPGDRVRVQVPNKTSQEVVVLHNRKLGTIIDPADCTTCEENLHPCSTTGEVPVRLDNNTADGHPWIAHYPPEWLFPTHA